jgi:hypothetical protein
MLGRRSSDIAPTARRSRARRFLRRAGGPSGEAGLTLIELLISMSVGVVVIAAGFGVMRAAANQQLRTQEKSNAQQRARIAVENVMLELHSGCVGPTVTPVWLAPLTSVVNGERLRFISRSSNEPQLEKVLLREIEYHPTGTEAHTLTEKIYENVPFPTGGKQPNFTFPATPKKKRVLLTHVNPSKTAAGVEIPIFQYYRYVAEAGGRNSGELSSTAMTKGELELEAKEEEEEVAKGEGRGNEVAKVSVNFSVGSEAEYKQFKDIGVTVTDSAVFRVDPSSTTPGVIDVPCT